jgi:hypothetical protein
MNKLKNWLVLLVTLIVTVDAVAQAVPHTTMDHRWQEGWYHETSPYTDREGNSWSVVASGYSRATHYTYVNFTPEQWSTFALADMDSSGNWTYSSSSSLPGSENNPEPFYWEPEIYSRECYSYDESGEAVMGSTVNVTTSFRIINSITRQPVNNKHRSTSPFNADVYWQWIPVPANCDGEEGALVTQLSGETYMRNTYKSINSPAQQARIVTFIAGKFPDPQ